MQKFNLLCHALCDGHKDQEEGSYEFLKVISCLEFHACIHEKPIVNVVEVPLPATFTTVVQF